MGNSLPKQYHRLVGKTVLRRTVEAFLHHPAISNVCVVIHRDHAALYQEAVAGLDMLPPAIGGETRQESVCNGLEHLNKISTPDYVLVHDAARCFVNASTINRVIEGLDGASAVVPTVPLSDTLKRVENTTVQQTIDRNGLHLVQTPQGFHFDVLYRLHQQAGNATATDDAMLAETAGIPVHCVQGDSDNIKLTTPQDWSRATLMTHTHTTYRTGMGYDVHRLVPFDDGISAAKRYIHLCGVPIAHSHKLQGHSDADVGLHALVDAILGALVLGDIGQHFPPSDPQWKGADSATFVDYVRKKLQERNAQLVHTDITLVCEFPKIAPHRAAMQKRVAELLHVSPDCISIKGTTTEGLGFAGRSEGIMAQAVATIALEGTYER